MEGGISGEWKEATCAEGETYYWNTVTKETCWELPDDASEHAGGGGTVSADATSAAAETIDTVSYVVFESPLFGQSKTWRICMIDERGPAGTE